MSVLNDIPLDHIFLRRLVKYFAGNPKIRHLNRKKRAAVSVIFRVHSPDVTSKSPISEQHGDKWSYLHQFLEENWVLNGRVQLLFIKKAVNEQDRWSGQVAFPGGRQEPKETDEETAVRETFEEVGLDLKDKTKFMLLGRLRDHNVWSSAGITSIAVSSFVWQVYLQIVPTTPKMKLASKEVAHCKWVDVDFFAGKKYNAKELTWKYTSINHSFINYTLHSPLIYLPDEEGAPPGPEYNLWGLTMAITTELLVITGFPSLNLPAYWLNNRFLDIWIALYFGLEELWQRKRLTKEVARTILPGCIALSIMAGTVHLYSKM